MQRHVFAKSVRPQRAYCKTTTYGYSEICSVLLGYVVQHISVKGSNVGS